MKVVCISDTHMKHEQLKVPDGDILIHSGDALGYGSKNELSIFNSWFGDLPHKHKIYVPGNHDRYIEEEPEEARSILTSATMLIDESFDIDGFKFYGSPWTPIFRSWSFMQYEHDLGTIFFNIPNYLDVLITHGPPRGILDSNAQGERCGSPALHSYVKQRNPKFHVFGHIHESAGIEQTSNTTFINASNLNGIYQVTNAPQVFELKRNP